MRYEVTIIIHVDEEANFLEVDDNNNLQVVGEIVHDSLYDLDDITVEDFDIVRIKNEIHNENI